MAFSSRFRVNQTKRHAELQVLKRIDSIFQLV